MTLRGSLYGKTEVWNEIRSVEVFDKAVDALYYALSYRQQTADLDDDEDIVIKAEVIEYLLPEMEYLIAK